MSRILKNIFLFFFITLVFVFAVSYAAGTLIPALNGNITDTSLYHTLFVFIILFPVSLAVAGFFAFHGEKMEHLQFSVFSAFIERPLILAFFLFFIFFLLHYVFSGLALDLMFSDLHSRQEIKYRDRIKISTENLLAEAKKNENEGKYSLAVAAYFKVLEMHPGQTRHLKIISELEAKITEAQITPEQRSEIFTIENRADTLYNKKQYAEALIHYEKIASRLPLKTYQDKIRRCLTGLSNRDARLEGLEHKDLLYLTRLNDFLSSYRAHDIFPAYKKITDLYIRSPQLEEVGEYYQILQEKLSREEFLLSELVIREDLLEAYSNLTFGCEGVLYTAEVVYFTKDSVYFRNLSFSVPGQISEKFKWGRINNNKLYLKNRQDENSVIRSLPGIDFSLLRYLHPENHLYAVILSPFKFWELKKIASASGLDLFLFRYYLVIKLAWPLFWIAMFIILFTRSWHLKKYLFSPAPILYIALYIPLSCILFLLIAYIAVLAGIKNSNALLSPAAASIIIAFILIKSVLSLASINISET